VAATRQKAGTWSGWLAPGGKNGPAGVDSASLMVVSGSARLAIAAQDIASDPVAFEVAGDAPLAPQAAAVASTTAQVALQKTVVHPRVLAFCMRPILHVAPRLINETERETARRQ